MPRTHARTPIILLIDDHDVRIIDAATGELLRELTIDPTRDYQPTPEADVVQSSGQAQGDFAVAVDDVAAHAVVGVVAWCGGGFGGGGVGHCWGGVVGQGAVGPVVVVVGGDVVEEVLESGDGVWLCWLGA